MLDAIKSAADAVVDTVKDVGVSAYTKVAESEIKKHTGLDIDVDTKDVPASWKDWVMKTGVNSLCTEDTWTFLEDSEWNKKKKDLWAERGIKKIIMTVNENPDPELSSWAVANVHWKEGEKEFTIEWLPRSGKWASDRSWLEPGYKRWWNLSDEIVFGLQLYQLPGKCFYKSDWLEGVEDPDAESPLPWATKKYKRWFQFRHWIIYWYANSSSGWNYQYTNKPPKLPDGSLFSLDSVLSLPSMPDLKMPQVKLPSLPDVELPSLPDVSLPSISAPSISAPSLSAPSLAAPSIPEKPMRPKGKWACHGFIELEGLNVKAKGKTLVLSDMTLTHFWEEKNGYIKNDKKEHQRFELECTSDEQANSWVQSLVASGCKEGEVGGCCTTA